MTNKKFLLIIEYNVGEFIWQFCVFLYIELVIPVKEQYSDNQAAKLNPSKVSKAWKDTTEIKKRKTVLGTSMS